MTKVSIIVPVYNVEKFLHRNIESLVNQTLREIEIIFVNDASPDNSLFILKEFKELYPEKIVIVDSKENLKQGGARNLGLAIAKGEYIGFVDSDDWVATDMYEKLYKEAKISDSDIVDCDYFIASSDKNTLGTMKSNVIDQIGILTEEKKKSLILESGRMWTKIFRRELFWKHDIKFSEKVFYEDNEIMPLLMVSAGKLSKVEEPLYYYFVNNNTSTTRKSSSHHHFDRLATAKSMLNKFKALGLYDQYKEEIEYRFIELYYLNTIGICLTKFDPPEIDYLRKISGYIKSNFPKYRRNIYFNKKTSSVKSLMSRINDISPMLLVKIFITASTILPRTLLEKFK